jgi:hypothetical protein
MDHGRRRDTETTHTHVCRQKGRDFSGLEFRDVVISFDKAKDSQQPASIDRGRQSLAPSRNDTRSR